MDGRTAPGLVGSAPPAPLPPRYIPVLGMDPDPEPDPVSQDPHVFEPPGSGCTDPDPSLFS